MFSPKSFLSGLEELLARVVSLLLTLLFFVIYALANSEPLVLDWFQLLVHLSVFWLVYEMLALIFFQTFVFFSASKTPNISTAVHTETILDIPETDTSSQIKPSL